MEAITIGNLPAERWINRRLKARLSDGIFTGGTCRGVYKNRILVEIHVRGVKQQFQIDPDHIRPNWQENPDLKAEAEKTGALFNGKVNLGRALQEAAERSGSMSKQPAVPAAPVITRPPLPVVEIVTVKAAEVDAPAAKEPSCGMLSGGIIAALPEPKEEAPVAAAPEVPVVAAAPEPAPKPSVGYAPITGVQASITADPTWVSDFADLQSLVADKDKRATRLEALKKELEKLKSEVRDDDELFTLYVQTLEQKGVILLRGTASVAHASPSLRPGLTNFERSVKDWLENTKPEKFTFKDVFDAVQRQDDSPRRTAIRAAADQDYTIIPSRRAQPLLFVRKTAAT